MEIRSSKFEIWNRNLFKKHSAVGHNFGFPDFARKCVGAFLPWHGRLAHGNTGKMPVPPTAYMPSHSPEIMTNFRPRSGCLNFQFPTSNFHRDSAFTLIELLTVMGIMAVLAAISIASYYGMTRGAGMRSAVMHLRSTLLLARQNAIITGKRTYVIFNQESSNVVSYVVCRHEGTSTIADNYAVRDDYTDVSAIPVNTYLYRLDTGERSLIVNNSENTLVTADSIWTFGAKFGWEIQSPKHLPRGFQFGTGALPPPPEPVEFYTDGTVRHPDDKDYDEMKIYETIFSGTLDRYRMVKVANTTGIITVEDGP